MSTNLPGSSPSSSSPTTEIVAGVWSRAWEEDPLGDSQNADRTTLVLWTQSATSGIYVDIRLPLQSPGRSLEAAKGAGFVPRPAAIAANGLSQESKDVILLQSDNQQKVTDIFTVMAKQKSFAGKLTYSVGDTTDSGHALQKDTILAELAKSPKEPGVLPLCTCFWRRHVDYAPPSGGLDIGVCASGPPNANDGSVLLRETGEDADYAEGWVRKNGGEKGPFMALELVSQSSSDNKDGDNSSVQTRRGYCVRAGHQFAYAIGRPSPDVAKAVGKSLADAVAGIVSSPSDQLDLMHSYLCVAGEINSKNEWVICHSTNPELVGCKLSIPAGNNGEDDLCCSKWSTTTPDKNVLIENFPGGKRVWNVSERTDCELPF